MALSLFSFPAFTAIYIKVYMEIIDLDLSCIPLQWASVTKWGRSSGGQFDINHCILSSLRSRRLKVVGEKENGRVSPSRAPYLSFAHYFQAPVTQAIFCPLKPRVGVFVYRNSGKVYQYKKFSFTRNCHTGHTVFRLINRLVKGSKSAWGHLTMSFVIHGK